MDESASHNSQSGFGSLLGKRRSSNAYVRNRERIPLHPLFITYRSDVDWPWDLHGGRRDLDEPMPSGDSKSRFGTEAARVRFMGGDPFKYGDLARWSDWVREAPKAEIELEGPVTSFLEPDVVARVQSIAPSALRLVVPSGDPICFEAIEAALACSIPVALVIPVNRATVEILPQTILSLADGFGGRVPLILKRMPVRDDRAEGKWLWAELPALGQSLARLPMDLGADLRIDEARGYAPCMIPTEALRPGLFPVSGRTRDPKTYVRPDACESCLWKKYCAWFLEDEEAPAENMTPLGEDAPAEFLEYGSRHVIGRNPGELPAKDSKLDLLDLVCFAPFTSIAINELKHRPVPCAQSWVHTSFEDADEAQVMEVPMPKYEEINRQSEEQYGVNYFNVENEDWSLDDMWNGPLHRLMRKQMLGGGPSERCRSMCRVLLGVAEKRGRQLLVRPDSELTPAIVANRNLLLEEVNSGKPILTAKPLDLSLGVASHCNISCGFCDGPQGTFGELSDRRLEQVIDLLPTLIHLSVVGPGEPLMSPNFLKLLEHIAITGYPAMQVSLTTNGTLVSRKWLKKHEAVQWSNFRISLNAGSAETHERMTGKQFWPRLMDTIEALAELNARPEHPLRLTLSCVLSTQVMGGLMGFAQVVDESGAHPVLEPMTGDLGGFSPYKDPALLSDLVAECREVAEQYERKNRVLFQAFDGMARYSEKRLAEEVFTLLPWR
ncbi:MAG: hypothetical protein CMH54_15100 [Myxococcales bacterium]|nr:hypothetical protein [Myxococcales bacterium]